MRMTDCRFVALLVLAYTLVFAIVLFVIDSYPASLWF